MSSEEIDMKEVQRQLSKVVDPEIGIPIVEMNLIDKLDIKDGSVDIQYHATTPYCPPVFALKISQDLKSNVQQVKGVKDVRVTVTGHYLSDAVNRQVNKPAAAGVPPRPAPRPLRLLLLLPPNPSLKRSEAQRRGEEDARPPGALEELDAALALLAAAIREAGGSDRMEVLKRAFRVNNAIGRLARQEPKLGQDLLQVPVPR